jgi:hypothetical protein
LIQHILLKNSFFQVIDMQIIDIYPAIIEACDFCDEFSSVSIVEDTFVVCSECLKFIEKQ